MNMREFWIKLNILYENVLIFCIFIFMLIDLYVMYDKFYIYMHSGNRELLKYKPVIGEYIKDESPISEDMVAWLTVDNTKIDVPVMQTVENVTYLSTDPFGNYSVSGSIFLDYRCNGFDDNFSIIYGHHMDYGQMFGGLEKFLNEDYLKKHTSGTLIVTGKNNTEISIEIFAAMRTSARNNIIYDFEENNIDGNNIAEYIKNNADVYTRKADKKILAMSTCLESGSVERIVVFAYLN